MALRYRGDLACLRRPPGYPPPTREAGCIDIPSCVSGRNLYVIYATAGGWEHASVSVQERPNRTPTWAEMSMVKALLWDAEDTVAQLHVPEVEHINLHPGVLHLWRPVETPIPLPPRHMV